MAWVNILSGSFPNAGAYTYSHAGTGVNPVGLYFETDSYPGTIDSDAELNALSPYESTNYVDLTLPIGTAVRVTYVGGIGGASVPTYMGIGYEYETSVSFIDIYYDDTETIVSGTNPIEEATLSATTKVYFGYSSEGTDPTSLRAMIEVEMEVETDEFWTDEINATETL